MYQTLNASVNMKKCSLDKLLISILIVFSISSCFNQTEESVDTFPTITLDKNLWSVKLPNEEYIASPPMYHENNLYIQTTSTLSVYDTTKGNLRWRLLLPSEDGGYEKWENPPLIFADEKIIIQSQRNTLTVYNSLIKSIDWASSFSPNPGGGYQGLSSFIEDFYFYRNMLFVTRYNTTLVSYNIKNGNIMWAQIVPDRTDLNIIPFEEKVLIGTNHSLEVYNIDGGRKLQTIELNGYVEDYDFEERNLYFVNSSDKCNLALLNIEKMSFEWCVDLDSSLELEESKILHDQNNLYVWGKEFLLATSKDSGNTKWQINPQSYFKDIKIIGDDIYASDGDDIYILRTSTGEKIAKFTPNININWQVLILEDTLFFFDSKNVFAYSNPFR
jgi:outer membrane protein assembly factor BamB